MGGQGTQMSWGCQKFHFREFSVSPQTSSGARKPLVLRHLIVYTSFKSRGLKEDEMGSQTPHLSEGGAIKLFSSTFLASWPKS